MQESLLVSAGEKRSSCLLEDSLIPCVRVAFLKIPSTRAARPRPFSAVVLGLWPRLCGTAAADGSDSADTFESRVDHGLETNGRRNMTILNSHAESRWGKSSLEGTGITCTVSTGRTLCASAYRVKRRNSNDERSNPTSALKGAIMRAVGAIARERSACGGRCNLTLCRMA